MKAEGLRKLIWVCVLVTLLVAAAWQLKVSFHGWKTRPFEEISRTIAKQDIPFPSVTICPSGITVWSGLTQFLNEREFKEEYREKLKRSHTTMVRLKIGSLNDRLKYKPKEDRSFTLTDCTDWSKYSSNRELCNFIQYGLIASRNLPRKIIKALINKKLKDNKGYVIENSRKKCKTDFICPYYRVLPFPSNSKLFEIFLDIITIEIIESKDITTAMDIVLQELADLFIAQPGTQNVQSADKSYDCIPVLEDCGANLKLNISFIQVYNQTLKLPSGFENKWTSEITTAIREKGEFLTSKFHQLKLLEELEFNRFRELGDFVIPLASLNLNDRSQRHHEYLSMTVALQTQEELNSFLNHILKEITGDPDLSWSLVDALDIFLATGSVQILDGRLLQAQPHQRLVNRWNSLSEEEIDCAKINYRDMIENLQISYINPCANPSNACTKFCKNLVIMQKHMKNPEIQQLMRYMSHPSQFQKGGTSWTVPFCFQGSEVDTIRFAMQTNDQSMTRNLSQQHYGYTFCPHVRQRVTDIGLCSTIEYDSKDSNVLPPKGVYRIFEKGMLMILDSFAYLDSKSNMNAKILRTQRDFLKVNAANLEHPDTLVDLNLNEFKVIIHNKNEVPLFVGPTKKSLYLSLPKNEMINKSMVYMTAFKVEYRIMEQRLADLYSVNERKCRFDHEIDNFQLFDVYSEENCIFECKFKRSRSTCGCTPWYIEIDGTTPVCDLFGNKCFEQMSLKTNDELDFSHPDSPACDCFPACRSLKYIADLRDTEQKEIGSPLAQPSSPSLKGFPNEHLVDLSWSGSPRHWENDTWVKEKDRHRFLFDYIKDLFKGNQSKIFHHGDLTSDVDMYEAASTCKDQHPMDCLMHFRIGNTPVLRIDFKEKYVKRIEVVERVPWYEKLSAIGGTLGLFLGFSILGIVDIFYWMFLKVQHYFEK